MKLPIIHEPEGIIKVLPAGTGWWERFTLWRRGRIYWVQCLDGAHRLVLGYIQGNELRFSREVKLRRIRYREQGGTYLWGVRPHGRFATSGKCICPKPGLWGAGA